MTQTRPQSLRRLLLTHEFAFLVLVAIAGSLGGVWAYFWQQTSEESIRLNDLAHISQEIRADFFRQIEQVTLARLRDRPEADAVNSEFSKRINSSFNQLRQRSITRAEGYAVQALQQAYGTIQIEMQRIIEDPELTSGMVRIKLLDPLDERVLVEGFENSYRYFRGLINQQLDAQSRSIERWMQIAPIALPVPIIVAISLLLFSRESLRRGFVRPVQSLVAALHSAGDNVPTVPIDPHGVSEVGDIVRSVNEMSREVEFSRDALVESERRAALGSLVPVVAHNIRNPLASIRATAQLLDTEDANLEAKEAQLAILETVDRLERWVSALVSYLHPLRPQMNLIPAAMMVDETLALLEVRLAEKSIRVSKDSWDADLVVDVDADLMEQALYALLSNALEATPSDGTIIVSIEQSDREMKITITDEGGGIPFIPQPTNLEPGLTTKMRGTGLGIPVAFKICKAHGWTISYVVAQHVGTTVVISAPLPDATKLAVGTTTERPRSYDN
ncbi:MAG: signal transduction histidine kinase [Gammaproteobacteria bacterium]|jgi:signal transduction histidine kinase